MLQIIEAHPNRPVYADVFEHPPPQLASQRHTELSQSLVAAAQTYLADDCHLLSDVDRRPLWSK